MQNNYSTLLSTSPNRKPLIFPISCISLEYIRPLIPVPLPQRVMISNNCNSYSMRPLRDFFQITCRSIFQSKVNMGYEGPLLLGPPLNYKYFDWKYKRFVKVNIFTSIIQSVVAEQIFGTSPTTFYFKLALFTKGLLSYLVPMVIFLLIFSLFLN